MTQNEPYFLSKKQIKSRVEIRMYIFTPNPAEKIIQHEISPF